jgi:hypothetical protein
MKSLLPFYCLFAHMAIMAHLGILYYKASGSIESKKLENSLNVKQKQIYEKIKKERMCDFRVGILLGMFLSFLYIRKMNTGQNVHTICVYVGFTTLVANAYYTLKPKSLWMVEHLSTLEQVKLHNEVYKKMKYITAYSELLGFILFAIGRMLK